MHAYGVVIRKGGRERLLRHFNLTWVYEDYMDLTLFDWVLKRGPILLQI